jgi:hypothetical protein
VWGCLNCGRLDARQQLHTTGSTAAAKRAASVIVILYARLNTCTHLDVKVNIACLACLHGTAAGLLTAAAAAAAVTAATTAAGTACLTMSSYKMNACVVVVSLVPSTMHWMQGCSHVPMLLLLLLLLMPSSP